ncbi:hypothetical protein POM88_018948 [Heracleum sosnowskyi]|uniref:Uncharacterized protein n=1 Tax=Heracleum sosnowskyi TaxID=360622 RepID=A0AAD8IS02_9APIA|nr:hypothetical protein POM88_018948 [Heracleum sosnowskyi]
MPEANDTTQQQMMDLELLEATKPAADTRSFVLSLHPFHNLITCKNHKAVEAGNIEYVNNILSERSVYIHLLDEQLTKGKSLLHAAIIGRNIDILQKFMEKKPMLIMGTGKEDTRLKRLLDVKRIRSSGMRIGGLPFIMQLQIIFWWELVSYLTMPGSVNEDNQKVLHVAAMYGKDCCEGVEESASFLSDHMSKDGSRLQLISSNGPEPSTNMLAKPRCSVYAHSNIMSILSG